ncbi:MAG TPA: sulfurtransferase [Thermoanaerobaculia bacterium]
MRRSIAALSALLWVLGAVPMAARVNTQLLVSTDWLQQHRLDRNVTIVEIGDRESFVSGHIAGARFVALRDLLIARDSIPNELPDAAALERTFATAGIPDRGRIILYSRDIIAAARAFFTLDYLGCGERTSILDGGYAKWSSEGRMIESGAPAVAAVEFSARPRPEALVRLTALRTILYANELRQLPLSLIDARAPAEYLGAEAGADIRCAGHVPGAINIVWNENLTSGKTPVFRSIDDLRLLYEAAGVKDGDTIVVYCRTGMQACVDYFVLRYLGRDVHLYDGSYIEWSRDEYGT